MLLRLGGAELPADFPYPNEFSIKASKHMHQILAASMIKSTFDLTLCIYLLLFHV